MKRHMLMAATLSFGVASLAAQAPPSRPATMQDAERPSIMSGPAEMDRASDADAPFAREAAMGGMIEVEMGRLAAQRASRDDIRQFAQRMVDDHKRASDELASIAMGKNMTLRAELPSAQAQSLLDKMGTLNGAALGRAFLADQIKEHEKAVVLFEKEARNGRDAELKAFAGKTLSTLKDHLAALRGLQARKTGSGG